MIRGIKKIISVLAILQIILLINFVFAQSYGINENEINVEVNIAKKIVKKSLNLIIGFLSIKQIGFVSAGCCEVTNEGAFCQDVPSGDECSSGYTPPTCDQTISCKQGWCIGSDGTCSVSSQVQCSSGSWSLNKPSECEYACCDAGANTQFVEQVWCETNGYAFDDRSEVECKYLAGDVEGACVYTSEDGITCKFTTADDCSVNSFYEGSLCSRENLNTDCEREQTIDCYNEKIYWFDSCGNRENVYEGNSGAEKDSSWNEGLVKDATNYCTVDLSDENSLKICGNCDRVTSTCKQTESGEVHVEEDNFVCEDLGCDEDGNGINERRSGESWCIYEGQVGEYDGGNFKISSDIPGTSHYRKACIDGKISLINCAEYRTQICAENITQVNGVDFSEAECRTNFGRECFGIDNKEDCEAKPDCRMQTVDVVYDSDVDFFKFDACVPRYPLAFNSLYSAEGNWNDGESVCGLASMTCPIVEQYKLEEKCEDPCSPLGSCEVCWYVKVDLQYVADKECDENPERFYSQMNDFCVSLGDCAGYINIEGNYTGKDSLKERYAGLEDVSKSDASNNLPTFLKSNVDESPSSIILKLINSNLGEFPESPEETLSNDEKNLQKFRMLNFAIGGAFAFVPGWGWIVAIIAAAIEGVLQLLGAGDVGEIEESSISFSCEPWEPPAQSKDCGKCNEGDLPCTKYKCWSLGKNCEVLENVYGTDEPICIASDSDPSPPVIEFKSIENFEFETKANGVRIINGSDEGKCFSGNTLISFNLTTDKNNPIKFSKCIWGEEPANYNDYKNIWDGETASGNAFTKEHEFNLNLPYYESNKVEGGNYKMYIRCENNKGRANVEEYVVNFCINPTPDITPPIIKRFNPTDGGYLVYGADTLINLKLYTNEPVISCKYSRDESTAYNDMINSLSCDSWETRQTEYECSFGDIGGLTEPTNTLYFKCNDSHGNANVQYTDYNILQSKSELKISSTQPKGYNQVSTGEDFASITLRVTTSGGADGTGVSKCYWNYSWKDYDSFADSRYHQFLNTDSTLHTQSMDFPSGSYNIPIKCEDSVGNIAEGTIQFVLDIDNTAPEIVAIYHLGDSLVVKTNKQSRCYYDNDAEKSCKVEKIAENLMDPKLDLAVEHNVFWDFEKTYHIQCVDNLDNVGACLSISPSIY